VSGFAEWLQATPLSVTIQSVSWVVPLLQSIHILTIGIVFVSSLMIAMRVLGRMRADEPFDMVWQRFSPWLWGGLAVMLVSGVILVIGEPIREFATLSFWLKMSLIVIGVTSTALLGRFLRPVGTTASTEFSAGAKTGAIALIVLWLAIIFLGRAIAYDTEVWGSLSLHPPT
jgi:uncharacterized membrane protein SirB2